jgi:hypothetical protein
LVFAIKNNFVDFDRLWCPHFFTSPTQTKKQNIQFAIPSTIESFIAFSFYKLPMKEREQSF